MAYNVNLSNGDLLAIVEDGTAEISKSTVALIGKNFPGYGEYINENFIHLVENFAGEDAPANQLTGQLWYQTNTGELKLWDSQQWVSAGKPTIVNDTVSTTPQFLTFVESSSGSPDFKVSAPKGVNFTPSTGNFGIGVIQGTSRLTVSKNSSTTLPSAPLYTNTVAHIHGNNGEKSAVTIDSYAGAGGNYNLENGPEIVLRRANGTSSTLEAVLNNDLIGSIRVGGYTGTSYESFNFNHRAAIEFRATENWSTGSTGTKMTLRVTPNGSAVPEDTLILDNNKNIGVPGTLTLGRCIGKGTFDGDLTVEGTIRAGGDVTAYYTSDQRLKIDIREIDRALEKVAGLDGVTFAWNADAKEKFGGPREPGLLAQQVQIALPEAVTKRDDGYLAVRYEKVIPLLVEAIKELKSEVDSLRSRLDKQDIQ
jgi:hypothetical protein